MNIQGHRKIFSTALQKLMAQPRNKEAFIIWCKSFIAMLCLGLNALFVSDAAPLLIGSFGASAVLLFATPQSPLAQPRNVLGGHALSAIVGVTVAYTTGEHILMGASLAVSLSIALMFISHTLHPPGGATALIAVIGGESIRQLGYGYVFIPTLSGACILLMMTWLLSKCTPETPYPAPSSAPKA